MITLDITPNLGTAPWTDLSHVGPLGKISRVGRLPGGTQCGKSTVAILVNMPDGQQVLAETTLALFTGAARALQAADSAERS